MENISENSIDILNRDSTVNRILSIIKNNAASEKFMSFAINGEQGVGKTYIVNRIIENLKKDNNFLVIKYDCWKNDYYEEPLKAILLNIIDEISYNIENLEDKIKEVIKVVISDLKDAVDKYLTDKRIIVYSVFKYFFLLNRKVQENSLMSKSRDAIDDNDVLKKVLNITKEAIRKLTKEKTLVIFVDELDRCVPDYAIKVLERTHHIYYGVESLLIIYVYDESSLIGSIKQMFGGKISIDKYFTKFINYSLFIETGECDAKIFEKYKSFFATGKMMVEDKNFISELITNSKVNARNINKMFENLNLINRIINIDIEYKNYVSIIQFEIIIYIVKLILKEYFKMSQNPSYANSTKSFVENIVRFSETNFDKVFPTAMIKRAIEYFYRTNLQYAGSDISQNFYDEKYVNLIDCLFILDQLYKCNRFKTAFNVDADTINTCKEIKNYIDMFTISI